MTPVLLVEVIGFLPAEGRQHVEVLLLSYLLRCGIFLISDVVLSRRKINRVLASIVEPESGLAGPN